MIFGGNRKKEQTGKFGHRALTLQRREPMPQHSPTPLRGMPSPRQGQGAKMAPLRYAMA